MEIISKEGVFSKKPTKVAWISILVLLIALVLFLMFKGSSNKLSIKNFIPKNTIAIFSTELNKEHFGDANVIPSFIKNDFEAVITNANIKTSEVNLTLVMLPISKSDVDFLYFLEKSDVKFNTDNQKSSNNYLETEIKKYGSSSNQVYVAEYEGVYICSKHSILVEGVLEEISIGSLKDSQFLRSMSDMNKSDGNSLLINTENLSTVLNSIFENDILSDFDFINNEKSWLSLSLTSNDSLVNLLGNRYVLDSELDRHVVCSSISEGALITNHPSVEGIRTVFNMGSWENRKNRNRLKNIVDYDIVDLFIPTVNLGMLDSDGSTVGLTLKLKDGVSIKEVLDYSIFDLTSYKDQRINGKHLSKIIFGHNVGLEESSFFKFREDELIVSNQKSFLGVAPSHLLHSSCVYSQVDLKKISSSSENINQLMDLFSSLNLHLNAKKVEVDLNRSDNAGSSISLNKLKVENFFSKDRVLLSSKNAVHVYDRKGEKIKSISYAGKLLQTLSVKDGVVFSTSDEVHRIGEDGEYLEGYPLRISVTGDMNYMEKRDLITVPSSSNRLFVLNRNAEQKNIWNSLTLKDEYQVLESKDTAYVLSIDNSLYALRSPSEIISDELNILKDSRIYSDNHPKATRFVSVDSKGNAKVTTLTGTQFGLMLKVGSQENVDFIFQDIVGDGRKDYIVYDDNNIVVYYYEGYEFKKMREYSFENIQSVKVDPSSKLVFVYTDEGITVLRGSSRKDILTTNPVFYSISENKYLELTEKEVIHH